jgi:hypothetical protein
VRVLFIGEGKNDRIVSTLARKVCPAIDELGAGGSGFMEIRDRKLDALPKSPGKFSKDRLLKTRGLDAKAARAVVEADRSGFSATVIVVDADEAPENAVELLAEGAAEGRSRLDRPHGFACGLAVQSIEAWTLGAPGALARVLRAALGQLTREYNPSKAESFSNTSPDDKNGWKLLERITSHAHRADCTEFREEVARETDIAELSRNCPQGFVPFAGQVAKICPGPAVPSVPPIDGED